MIKCFFCKVFFGMMVVGLITMIFSHGRLNAIAACCWLIGTFGYLWMTRAYRGRIILDTGAVYAPHIPKIYDTKVYVSDATLGIQFPYKETSSLEDIKHLKDNSYE